MKIYALGIVPLALTGCAQQVGGAVQSDGPGFFMGLIHGALAPIAFVGSLFADNISVYAVPNNGGWYDFGFLIALLCVWAGGGAAASN